MSQCFEVIKPFNQAYIDYCSSLRSLWLALQERSMQSYVEFAKAVSIGGFDSKTYWDEYMKYLEQLREASGSFCRESDARLNDYVEALKVAWGGLQPEQLNPYGLGMLVQVLNCAAGTASLAQAICCDASTSASWQGASKAGSDVSITEKRRRRSE